MGRERQPADELHGEIRLRPEAGIVRAGFVDLSDARVLQAAQGLGFVLKPPQSFGRAESWLDDFERPAAARLFLLGLIHGAHTALAQQTNNPIPADGSWKRMWASDTGRARATGQRFGSG